MAHSQRGRKRRAEPEEEPEEDNEPSNATDVHRTSAAVAVQRQELLAKFIRYTLFMHTKRRLIRREDYTQHVFAEYKRQNLMEDILPLAKQFFTSTFGYTLIEHQRDVRSRNGGSSSQATPKASTVYFLVLDNVGSNEDTHCHVQSLPRTNDQCRDCSLLTTILGLLQYNGGSVGEELLWHLLSRLGLGRGDPKGDFSEPVEQIVDSFVRQRYLEKVKGDQSGEERASYTFRRGVRAEFELPDSIDVFQSLLAQPASLTGDIESAQTQRVQ